MTVPGPAFAIAHAVPGRLRGRPALPGPVYAGDTLLERLCSLSGVGEATFSPRTGSLLIRFSPDAATREAVLRTVAASGLDAIRQEAARLSRGRDKTPREAACVLAVRPCAAKAEPGSDIAPVRQGRLGGLLQGIGMVARFLLMRSFMPPAVRGAMTFYRAWPYLKKGLGSLSRGHLGVDVLDATAIAISLARRDYRSAMTVVVMLGIGEFLESWTRKRSREDLAEALHLDDGVAWVRVDGVEVSKPASDLVPDDLVVVRTGSAVPVDGIVEEGEAMVNQSTLTGEPLAVRRTAGASVFAGTVVEDGVIVIRTRQAGGETRLRRMLAAIEDSERSKAMIQGRAERLADAVVPLSLGLAGGAYLLTRDPTRAASVLLVDYSCAIKLATPLAVLAAMRQAAGAGALIKGGRFMEVLATADVALFDKTGTLTEARPSVQAVLPVKGRDARDLLRLAACLEEHFPHPVARAVVRKADEEGLTHKEEHAEVQYIAAHGIASMIHGQRVLLGSAHFVHEDEGIPPFPAAMLKKAKTSGGCSVLHMAIGGEPAGLILLDDPIRPEAADVVAALRARGIERIVMVTGDGQEAAETAARAAGIDEVRARMLPEDKRSLVRELKAAGHVVAVIGDGVNDSWALSEADVGVSLSQAADVAREVCDVLLTGHDLRALPVAIDISRAALARISLNFRLIVGLNSGLLLMGLLGLLRPAASALLHNLGTVLAALNAVRPLALPAPRACTPTEDTP